jgi:hypothetical protein
MGARREVAMNYTTERLPGEPIIIHTLLSEYRLGKDTRPAIQEIAEVANKIEEKPVYIIIVTYELRMNFGDLVQGLAMATRGETAIFTDPSVRLRLVGSGGLVELGARAFEQRQYGGLDVRLYPTLEDALEGIRQEIAASSQE